MRTFIKQSLGLIAFLMPISCWADAAQKPKAPSDTCLSPLPTGSPPLVIRDVHATIAADKKSIDITMCIASTEQRGIQQYSAVAGLFHKNGAFIESAGNTYNNIPPLNGATNGPTTVILFATAPAIDPSYADDLLNETIIQGSWIACKDGPPKPCVADTPNTIEFLVPLDIQQAQTAMKRHRRR